MDKYRAIYCVFLLISLILSVVCKKQEKGLEIFPVLLSISLVSEIITEIFNRCGIQYQLVYHIYIPLEYCLWSFYFYQVNEKAIVRKIIMYAVPSFALFCLIISSFVLTTAKFPTIQLNMEGILLVFMTTYTIFTIQIRNNISIFSRPVFWVCVAVLVYYSSIASFMSMYNLISDSMVHLLNPFKLYFLIFPNYFLYTGLSIAFVCSQRIKKL
jgi:hypothetical protein